MIAKGIKFDNIHSFYDLNLFLSGLDIPPAKVKTNFVDIPGGDGSVDLTEAHGEVKYYDRECKFTFTMNPAGGLSDADYEAKKTEVSNAINGRRFRITLDKDPEFYYLGRVFVDEYQSNKRLRQIIVGATVKPYKFHQEETVLAFALSETGNAVEILNGRRSVCPVITCTNNDTMIKFKNTSYSLSAGTQKVLDIRLEEGINNMVLSGKGSITFKFQQGEL